MAPYYTRKVTGKLKSETRGALSLTSFSGLFQGTHHPKARTWEDAEPPRAPNSLCPTRRQRESIPAGAWAARPLLRRCDYNSSRESTRRAGPNGAGMSAELSRPPLLAQLGERRAQVGEGAAGVAHAQQGERASGSPRARGGALRRAAGTSLRVLSI